MPTGAGKAGCSFFSSAMIRAMLEVTPEHRSLFPSLDDFYFDALIPIRAKTCGMATASLAGNCACVLERLTQK